MIAVIDTNVLLQAIGKSSIHKPIWQGIIDEKYKVAISSFILLEYEEIIARKASIKASEIVQKIFLEFPNVIHIHPEFKWNAISKDMDDNKFFDAAIAAGADYLETNDAHFNEAKKLAFPKIHIVSADEFLTVLQFL